MLYKNVKFSLHPVKTIKPSPPHPKKNLLEIKNAHALCHLISTEPNLGKTPSTPTREKIPWKEKKEKKNQLFI